MKLLEQYIYAIGKHLPYKTRDDIKKELHGSLLDEIEAKYGQAPTEKQLEEAIMQYGTPREVANRYKGDHLVIGRGYTDLFFFIAKLIVFALSIAFTVLFIVGLFEGDITGNRIMVDIAKIFGQVINGSLSGLGWLTAIFIILTHFNQDDHIDLEDDWTPKELKDIKIGPESESRIGSGFAIFFSLLFIAIINLMPHLPSIGERLFDVSGLLGHQLNIELFKIYLIPLSILWLAEVVYHIMNLFYGTQTKAMAILSLVVEILSAALLIQMALNMDLYLAYEGLVGFRSVFIVIAAISTFESLKKSVKYLKYYVLKA